MEYPPAFRGNEPWISRTGIAVGRMFSDFVNLLLPGKKHADVVLVANQRTREALPAGIRGQVIEMVENGVDTDLWKSPSQSLDHSSVPRFVFVGRLVDWKAVDVVIRALQQVPTAEVEIIGDGPMLQAWKGLAKELGMENRVHFLGWLSQKECALRLQSSIALVLPSLYECGGAVVLEAMAMGKPVIATKWGGPADYLDASCGILIEPESTDSLVNGFAAAMQKLATSPDLARSMGAAGYALSIKNFDWQRKIDHMTSIYQMSLQQPN
jgi:glycosyltransferase involved in cell wall biosynthesis